MTDEELCAFCRDLLDCVGLLGLLLFHVLALCGLILWMTR